MKKLSNIQLPELELSRAFLTNTVSFLFQGAAGGGSQPPTTVIINTASLNSGANEAGTVTIGNQYRLLGVQSNRPCRIRIYASTAQRDADVLRAIGVDPNQGSDHGLVFEYITAVGLLSASLSPTVDFADINRDQSIPYNITNLDSVTGVCTVTLTLTVTE